MTKVKQATLAFIKCQVINHTSLTSFFTFKKTLIILITEETEAILPPPWLSHMVRAFHNSRRCILQPTASPHTPPTPQNMALVDLLFAYWRCFCSHSSWHQTWALLSNTRKAQEIPTHFLALLFSCQFEEHSVTFSFFIRH